MSGINMGLAWAPNTAKLQYQRYYLEDLLSKTATTLHTLREKQTRTDRILATGPSPRTKKKRIMQTRWRTSKTIQTCENEEKMILDCLKVCNNNLDALQDFECSNYRIATESAFTPKSWYSNATLDIQEFNPWSGIADDWSPFQQPSQYMTEDVEVAPHQTYEEALLEKLHLLPGMQTEVPMLDNRPEGARLSEKRSPLSPLAATFEPHEKPHGVSSGQDKLSVPWLLAATRHRQLRQLPQLPKRRFSDASVSHLFRSLSRPRFSKKVKYASWSPAGSSPECTDDENSTIISIKRTMRLHSTAF